MFKFLKEGTKALYKMNSNHEEEGKNFDVFLSFCGKDTRNVFTSHLYNRLDDAAVRVFMDSKSLRYGEKIDDQLIKRIKQSKISIPILSKNYASRKYCLMELALMMECRDTAHQTVMPVFYDVSPHDVRQQTGPYQDAFDVHATLPGPETTVAKWRKALSDVGEVKGWELATTYGDEGELVKKLAAEVIERLKIKDDRIDLTDSLVGLEDYPKIKGLSDAQKYIFLDIACFWIGKLKYYPNYLWEDHFNHSASRDIINVLRSSSLIKVKNDRYWMSNEHRDLGREIVQREYNDQEKRTWLWKTDQGADQLRKNKVLSHIEAICLHGDNLYGPKKCVKGEQLANLPNLRFIKVHDADLEGNYHGALQKVSYLRIEAPFRQTLQHLSLENIVVLDLSGSGVKDDWEWSTKKVASKLKDLNLSDCQQLKRGPNFSMFPNLERLDVDGCKQLVSMDLSNLTSLIDLDASNCKNLQVIYGLDQLKLQWVDTSGSDALRESPN